MSVYPSTAIPFGRARLAVLIASILGTASSIGQEQQEEPEQASPMRIEEVIVEGRRVTGMLSQTAVDFTRYGTQVQLIDAEKIETGGFTNFGELAAGLIRGANIGYSPDEGEFTIRLDGGTDRDTLLLLDGMPTFDRGTPLESIWPATALDPRMIASVEVYRGGQSLYYGGNGGLGVVRVNYKQPYAGEEIKGELGVYGGSFDTREMYGNISLPLFGTDNHALMLFGRSYETQAHELFDREAHVDNVIALGGFHEFPYSYNLVGAKYHWRIGDETELRLGGQYATVDFRDSFPNYTIYQPNYTEFPMFNLSLQSRLRDNTTLDVEGYYIAPKLYNTELDARICNIPRLQDLSPEVQAIAASQNITGFSTAAEFESFAAGIDSLPAGCVTNPYGNRGLAAVSAQEGFYVDENGNPYGTFDNPFPIGNPIGTVIQSTASFGTGVPTKGFGDVDQFKAGYVDLGLNARIRTEWSDNLTTVFGVQNITYFDDSNDVYGMTDDEVRIWGVYGDLQLSADFLEGTALSLALRHDFNDPFEDETIWKYGFRQELPGGFYLRSNGGTSYSNPTLTEIGAVQNRVINSSLQTQAVETYSFGAGINGEALGGTYNIELGYFDTEIDNLFGASSIERVCPEVAALTGEPNLVDNIRIPTEFCAFALQQFNAGILDGRETVSYNSNQVQEISGVTLDIAFNIANWDIDFTFTDMESLEPNPRFGANALLAGTGEVLDFVVPGAAGSQAQRQSSERPEWSAATQISFRPTDRIVVALNTRFQGAEWAYAGGTDARLVDANGNRTNPDLNFGDYVVVNGSLQYFMGRNREHRFMLRAVNIFDEQYFERASASADRRVSRAGVRGEIGQFDPDFYYQYGWNGKPRSFWL
ncbi:MAG: TonB-dependent receptor, partial [Halieaceae bacterium]|nr:TonB-dependent receptor [Halieaceae bacterium]